MQAQQYPPNYEFRTAIIWFRRDLRVDDNPALVAALNAAANVIPVFIWAPEEEGQFQPGRCSRWWTKHSLVDLQQAIAALGSRLIIRRSTDSTAALLQIVAEVGAEAVFFNHLYDPISLMRDHDCKRGLTAAGVAHRTFNSDMLYEPWEVLDANKQAYSTFDDYWNGVRAMPVPPPFPVSAPSAMAPVPASVASMGVGEVDWFFTAEQEASSDQLKFKWKPGVGGAISELERFLGERLHVFELDRAKVDRDSTSRLSPWIHIGSISVRYIFYRVRQCQAEWLAAGADRTKSCDDFLQQVGYREYSRYLSFHFPFIHERSLLRHLRACPWRIDQHAFKAWRQGQTGYPIVDAAMRQLWSSGWCHNRARVVAASFLVKDLLLPWQWGLKHYWDAQIDADLECDALGWQYVSGGMSDAHPFSYMMDLEAEARRFDPDGEYVRRWLPVLSRLPTEHVHAPWKAPPQVLAAADVELGCNYPAPIISHTDAKANVQYACSVLDKCVVAQYSESSGKNPYRAPTYPAAPGMGGGSGGNNNAGASSGANLTGNNQTGPSAGTGGGTGTGTGTGTAFHNNAHNPASAPTSQQHPHGHPQHPQGYVGGGTSGEAAGTGTGPNASQRLPESRSASAAHGGVSTGRGGGGGGAQPLLPPQHAAGAGASGGTATHFPQQPPLPATTAAAAAAPYYHPGDAAGQEMLERILRQQRRARGAARHKDGSGTNNPNPYNLEAIQRQRHPHQQHHQMAPYGDAGDDGAAAWAGREEVDDEAAAALWQQQQQQMLQEGTAAYAFEQAMQLLLARRRMGDGASVFSGDRGAGGEGGDGLVLEDADSEEVVSNTVELNLTAFTGASGQRGTARGARHAVRATASTGGPGGSDEDMGSPGDGNSPHRRGRRGDAAGPSGALLGSPFTAGHERFRRQSLSGDNCVHNEAMQCDQGGEAAEGEGAGASPQGGEGGAAAYGLRTSLSEGGAAEAMRREQGEAEVAVARFASEGDSGARQVVLHGAPQQHLQAGQNVREGEHAQEQPPHALQPQSHGRQQVASPRQQHKRRRSGSGSLDWE